jgi:hypothetical protein
MHCCFNVLVDKLSKKLEVTVGLDPSLLQKRLIVFKSLLFNFNEAINFYCYGFRLRRTFVETLQVKDYFGQKFYLII